MDIHSIVDVVMSLLVLCGALFMLAAILAGRKMRRHIPEALLRRWRFMTMLMQFFLVGYLLFIIILISRVAFRTELVTGPVFLFGAVFVFIVIKLTQETIRRIRQAEENLRVLNESLEQRVTDRTQELERSREFLKTILDSLNDEVLIIDVKTRTIDGVNAAFLNAHHLCEEDVIGRKCHEITHHQPKACMPPDDTCPLLETVATGRYAAAEHVHFDARGNKQYVEISSSPIRDGDGRITRIAHVSRDITERKLVTERIEHIALHDTLTGLPNRTLFFDRLNQVIDISKRNEYIFAVLYIDLDDFKTINDTFGHEAGDQLLQEVSKILTSITRRSDTIARMGGDEFVGICCMIKSPDDAEVVAKKIIANLSRPYELKGQRCTIGVSIGSSIYPRDGEDAETLLKKADGAMYQVKKSGKGGYLSYRES